MARANDISQVSTQVFAKFGLPDRDGTTVLEKQHYTKDLVWKDLANNILCFPKQYAEN